LARVGLVWGGFGRATIQAVRFIGISNDWTPVVTCQTLGVPEDSVQ
jgi:hypothetical protein